MDPPHMMMIANQTDVALSLTKQVISAKAKDVNFVFSPVSIYHMLSLIAAGSKGQTLDELLLFLKSNRNDLSSLAAHLSDVVLADAASHGGPRISFVTGAWVDRIMPFKKEFRNIVDGVYKATTEQVDFRTKAAEAVQKVNSWAKKETNGLIKDLLSLDSVDDMTRLILANAIYFKGVWADKFSTSATKYCDFHLLDGNSVKAPFMTSKKNQFLFELDGFKVLQLPYKQQHELEINRQFSMYIFLPDAKDGLPALAEKLYESAFMDKILCHIAPGRKVEVGNFLIPKFKISFAFQVSDVLKDLGLISPFKCMKDFTEMVDDPLGEDLYISGIYHKSIIEVNEEGTEAAAATGAVVTLQCRVKRRMIDFVADHPFLFVVRENVSGVILFIGNVLNPLVEG
ncbi:unnamed protein product [Rhodiola kirilowii]